MMTIETFFGGGRNHALTGNLTLKAGWPRLHTLDPDGAGREVNLPDARLLRLGSPQFILLNIDATHGIAVKDNAGGTVLTLAAQEGVILSLSQNSTAAGRWNVHRRSL
jgi:hypothetical protein